MKRILFLLISSSLLATVSYAQKSKAELPINWDDSATVDYATRDFDGTASNIDVSPTNANNIVLKTVKNAGQIWAGTVIGDNVMAKKVPFEHGSMTVKALVYSPDTGIIVKLKVENGTNAALNAEVDVKTTVANAWDTLTFDFSSPTNGRIDTAVAYEKIIIFYDFGVNGTGKTYYVDNIWFAATSTPPASKAKPDFPITWEDSATVDYATRDFDGTVSNIDVDPSNPNNKVLKTVKNAGQVWAGTVIGDNSMAKKIPFSATDKTIKALVYSPDTGIIVKLKVENGANGAINAEVDVKTTVANAWDTLTFDFNNPTNGSIDITKDYEKLVVFYDFGVNGTGKTYYVDNIWFYTVPPVTKAKPELPITWEDTATVNYATRDFDGTVSNIDVDPMNANNTVLKTVKNAGQVWAGTVIADNNLDKKIPFTTAEKTMKAIVYSPDTGIIVKMKVENGANGAINAEVDVKTTVANAWDTLTFDFHNPTNGTIDPTKDYEKVIMFYDFGVNGTGKTYYVDNIWFYATGTPPPPMKDKIDLPITWDDTANVNYAFNDFGGTASEMAADPNDASNLVLKTTKNAGQTWAGTTLGSNGLKNEIPFGTNKTIMKARVYSPDAGIKVRLKVENDTAGTTYVETEATTSVANGWETLSFDFSNQVTAPILDTNKRYDKVSIFYDFGTMGSGKVYYVDSVYMGVGGSAPVVPDTFAVTFKVDMRNHAGGFTTPEVNGEFNGWCGTCGAMADTNSDNIWEKTIRLAEGTYEFKYSFDNWAGQEELDTSLSCVKTTGTYTNRIITVSKDMDYEMCWDSCTTCFPAAIQAFAASQQAITVYPNPANDVINIDIKSSLKNIVITDVLGNTVFAAQDVTGTIEVPVANFENGIYLINTIDDNNEYAVKRFVKY